jgi:hypothetical protein
VDYSSNLLCDILQNFRNIECNKVAISQYVLRYKLYYVLRLLRSTYFTYKNFFTTWILHDMLACWAMYCDSARVLHTELQRSLLFGVCQSCVCDQ